MPKTNTNTIFSEIAKTKPEAISLFKIGEVVEGIVIEKSPRMILVDLDKHGIGVIYGNEIKSARRAVKDLSVGDPVHAKVTDLDNEDGCVELSIADADKQKSWLAITELAELDKPFKVKIMGFNKGGLTAEVQNIKAFLPVSQLSPENYPSIPGADKTKIAAALEKFVGEEF